jgi:hypothetical protein
MWFMERLRELRAIPYEPYAPVRKQLLKLLFLINQKRRTAGYTKVPADVFRYRRAIVKVFEPTYFDRNLVERNRTGAHPALGATRP